MWEEEPTHMKLLLVHERLGAFAGAESNILATADGLKERGHDVGILHGNPTGKGEATWREIFGHRFPLAQNRNAPRVRGALETFQPDAIYVHKISDLEILEALLDSDVPLVRMVHDQIGRASCRERV